MRWALSIVLAAFSFVVGGVIGIALDRKHRPKGAGQKNTTNAHTVQQAPNVPADSFHRFYRACRVSFAHNLGAQQKLLQHFEEIFFEAGFDQLRVFALIDRDQDGVISFDDFAELPQLFANLLSESEPGDFEALFESLDISKTGQVTATDWHQNFQAAGCALKAEIAQWLYDLLISHHDTVDDAFSHMDRGEGIVTVQDFAACMEEMLGVRLPQIDLARIVWALDADVTETGCMPVQGWVECLAGVAPHKKMLMDAAPGVYVNVTEEAGLK